MRDMPLFFKTFISLVKQMWHMYNYVLKHPFEMIYLSRFLVRNTSKLCVYTDIIIFALPLFTSVVKENWDRYIPRSVISQDIYSINHIEMCLDLTVRVCEFKCDIKYIKLIIVETF